jgi:acylphosphatase
MAERLEIRIRGRVQGVGFRWSAQRRALELGLVGWVRNLPDGSVQMLAEGPREKLAALLAWSREGPPHAYVDEAAADWSAATGEFDEYRITG